jgi:hypothetical protein
MGPRKQPGDSHLNAVQQALLRVEENFDADIAVRTQNSIRKDLAQNWDLARNELDLKKEEIPEILFYVNNQKMIFKDPASIFDVLEEALINTDHRIFNFLKKYFNDDGFKGISRRVAAEHLEQHYQYGSTTCTPRRYDLIENPGGEGLTCIEHFYINVQKIEKGTFKFWPDLVCSTTFRITKNNIEKRMEIDVTANVTRPLLNSEIILYCKTDKNDSINLHYNVADKEALPLAALESEIYRSVLDETLVAVTAEQEAQVEKIFRANTKRIENRNKCENPIQENKQQEPALEPSQNQEPARVENTEDKPQLTTIPDPVIKTEKKTGQKKQTSAWKKFLLLIAPAFYRVYSADSMTGQNTFNYKKIDYPASDLQAKNQQEYMRLYLLHPLTMAAAFLGWPNQCEFGVRPSFTNLLRNFLGWEKYKSFNREMINYALTPLSFTINLAALLLTLPLSILKFVTEFLPLLAATGWQQAANAALFASREAACRNERAKARGYRFLYLVSGVLRLICEGFYCLGRTVTSPIKSASAGWTFCQTFRKQPDESRFKKAARYLAGAALFLLSTAITVTAYAFLFMFFWNVLPAVSVELPEFAIGVSKVLTDIFNMIGAYVVMPALGQFAGMIGVTLSPVIAGAAVLTGTGLTTAGKAAGEVVDTVRSVWRTTNVYFPKRENTQTREACKEPLQEINKLPARESRHRLFSERVFADTYEVLSLVQENIEFFMEPFRDQKKFAEWANAALERREALSPLSLISPSMLIQFNEAMFELEKGRDTLLRAMVVDDPAFGNTLRQCAESAVVKDWYATYDKEQVITLSS